MYQGSFDVKWWVWKFLKNHPIFAKIDLLETRILTILEERSTWTSVCQKSQVFYRSKNNKPKKVNYTFGCFAFCLPKRWNSWDKSSTHIWLFSISLGWNQSKIALWKNIIVCSKLKVMSVRNSINSWLQPFISLTNMISFWEGV